MAKIVVPNSIVTKSVTGKGKSVYRKRLISSNYRDCVTWDGHEYDSASQIRSLFDTGLYHDPSGTGNRPFMGTGNTHEKSFVFLPRNLDHHLAAEEEELTSICMQLKNVLK